MTDVSVSVFNMSGEKIGSMNLDASIFDVEVNKHVVHQAVVAFLANQRIGTKCTKTRAEVRGGGIKPRPQKGTGRARQGSIRSPQWTGGGVVFAPKQRDFSVKLNKKVKRLALKSVLTEKVQNNKFIVVDGLGLDVIKTKEMKKVFDNLKVDKALLVMPSVNKTVDAEGAGKYKNIILSSRNLPNVKTAAVNTINVYDILMYDSFVATKDAVMMMQEVYA